MSFQMISFNNHTNNNNNMQNVVMRHDKNRDEEVVIFSEYTDLSGFVVREMLETKNEAMRFQVGRHVMKPMLIPVYQGSMVTHHKDGDGIQKFELHGTGRTKEEALGSASNKLLRRDIEKHQTRSELVACGIGV